MFYDVMYYLVMYFVIIALYVSSDALCVFLHDRACSIFMYIFWFQMFSLR